MKKDDIVYVEPGKGWGYVATEPDQEGNMEVVLIQGPTGMRRKAQEDDVFLLHEESFLMHIESIKDRLMSYAGNYDCPDEEEAKEIVEELETLLKMAVKAKSRGQFRGR